MLHRKWEELTGSLYARHVKKFFMTAVVTTRLGTFQTQGVIDFVKI